MIQREQIRDSKGVIIEDRYAMCRTVTTAAVNNQIEIATSTFSYVEVCKEPKLRDEAADKIAAYFENDYVLPVNLDRAVGERGRELMMKGYSKLKPADACHLASAVIANAEEMHTFDDKLLALDGKIEKLDGTKLKICKPDPGGRPAPLLEAIRAKPHAQSPSPAAAAEE